LPTNLRFAKWTSAPSHGGASLPGAGQRGSPGLRRIVIAQALLLSAACAGASTKAHGGEAAPLLVRPAPSSAEAPLNIIQIENREAGDGDWLITRVEGVVSDARDGRYQRQKAIEGYVSHTSIRAGEALTAFVSTQPPAPYRVDVYRMGYYAGRGGRRLAQLGPLQGVTQPEPAEGEQQLIEARWQPSFQIPIEPSWRSGVYLATLTTLDSGLQSYLVWVVRDDRKADLMLQVSDLTWQAYNRWPGWRSLYDWKGEIWHDAPGAKVSFDRPYGFYYNKLPANLVPKTNGSGEFLLWEFPLAYWLEQHGYDVTYVSGLDTDRDGQGLLRARAFISVGHDEYWSRRMVDNVARARDAGVNLAFLSGNAVDGEISIQPSTDGRQARVFERSRARGPSNEFADEQQLMGSTSYGVGLGDWVVQRPEHWLFEGTGMALGDRLPGLVGWEYHGPPLRDDPTLVVLASGKVHNRRGEEQSPDFAATIYDGPRGNIIFNAATCWWSMLLSAPPGFVNPPEEDFARSDPRVDRITRNLVDFMIREPRSQVAPVPSAPQ
jgi:N,N-dimethylformamidase beta subunit-like protein